MTTYFVDYTVIRLKLKIIDDLPVSNLEGRALRMGNAIRQRAFNEETFDMCGTIILSVACLMSGHGQTCLLCHPFLNINFEKRYTSTTEALN